MGRSVLRTASVAVLLLAAACDAKGPPVGSITVSVKAHIPDSLRSQVPVGDTVQVDMTLLSDGRRFAFELNAGAALAAVMPGMQNAKVRVVYAPSGDSAHVGLIFPPELVSMIGTPGYRVDFPLSMVDSLMNGASQLANMLPANIMDSIKKSAGSTPIPLPVSLGTSSTIAGLKCENWSMAVAADTIVQCMIPTPPLLQAMQDKIMHGALFKKLMEAVPGAAEAQAKAYGGRKLTAIMMSLPRNMGSMALSSFTSGAPPAATFDLPAGLQVVPIPAGALKLPGGTGGQ